MGTGDFICISMTGGAPWGFRLQGGKEQKQPLHVAKIRSQSKASGSGLCEGDEVVSINGNACADLTYPEVIKLMESITDSLQMLIKRPSSGINETLISETENKSQEHPTQGSYVESTTLQIQPATKTPDKEICATSGKNGVFLEDDHGSGLDYSGIIKEETGLSYQVVPQIPDSQRGHLADEIILREKVEAGQPGPVVELQLSLSQERPKVTRTPTVTLLGAEKSKPHESDTDLQCDGIIHINSVPAEEKKDPSQRSSKIIQICSSKELRVIPGREAGDPGLPQVEVILDCSDRQKTEGCRLQAGKGYVDSPVEGGQLEAPPSLVSFAVSSEGTEQGEDPRSDRDYSRPHKHRARHARLRRSESLSEKQVKEAKSKCKSIALLLTDAPNPNSKGVLMFKKRRRRARKYTLVSYGTGELEREADEEEGGDREDSCEIAFLGTSESEVDEELLSDVDDTQVVTFDWDSGLVDIEKKLNTRDKMEMLPDTTGKGALMFAKRRERMDQITAQKEEERVSAMPSRAPDAAQTDGLTTISSYQRKEEERVQTAMSRSYAEVSHGFGNVPQQNGFSGVPETAEAQRIIPMNRTAKPFPGSGNQPATPFSPTRNMTSPLADFPAPPPYSAITPPPDAFSRGVVSPIASPTQPPPWPQPAPWSQAAFYDSSERIASRDERIAVPAKRTGILQEAKRRNTTKPMFTFKEPKVSPNPELLSLLQNSEGKRGTGAGGDSGPEEDYLSLGAEACNFMQSSSAKQKTPPPVAPKPAVKSSSQPVTPVTPVSPVWSPGGAPNRPPTFPTSNSVQGPVVSSIKIAQPAYPPARPASALNLGGPYKGPQAAVASQNYAPKPTAPAPTVNTAHASAVGPSNELPGMSGKGAQLFAKRQSRMEKYVVDSDTVQAHAARAQSPTPSLPASWKYSSNVRAPPPVGYNPILSPSYPLAAVKSQSSAPQASKTSKKKGKKPLNALDVMKHQPYQLNASLFTFQPPDAKESLPQKSTARFNSGPALKQALPPRPVNASSPTSVQPSSVYSVPAYSSQPAFIAEATSPVSASPVPVAIPTSPKQESTAASYFVAPRPKFSAKKSGVTVQSGCSLSLPGRPLPPTISTIPPWMNQPASAYNSKPADGSEKTRKRLTPWEAAAKSPLGLVDDAFRPRNIQESIVANVVSAARRKVLSVPSENWKERVSYAPQTQKANISSLGRHEYSVASIPSNRMSTSSQYGSQLPCAYYRQPSRNDSEIMSMETRSDYCLSVADCNYNAHPRGWRRQT
ncbi:PREDICTED: synaptopodin-2 isoform X2 [Elephantulus edwardii]|uniref:synaptopodin-2 isoform X2 n=1 Tax=Elephantulus edwardii TaxID=28737 RepID=UPI0003F0AF35|nr:PREDICTED: synaptopodin-2 isoform X2 [Elephantulus edwardii]